MFSARNCSSTLRSWLSTTPKGSESVISQFVEGSCVIVDTLWVAGQVEHTIVKTDALEIWQERHGGDLRSQFVP